jgi:hypothetical protein
MQYRKLALILVAVALSMAGMAVTPQFWENFSQDELLKGTLTGVSLSADGKLSLAPSYDMVYDTSQACAFSMVRDKAGNLYLGTGHEGKVYKVDAQGNGSLYFESKELDVYALALDSSDTLYVGTSPDGKVYKVTAPNQSTTFCDPESKYIWSMLFDDSGNLYVGTGARGIILKVDRTGKKSTFFDSDDTHIVSMLRDSNGNLIAGTSPAGLVLSINAQGKAFTMLDTPMEEVRALAIDRFGTLYAVASGGTGPASGAAKPELSIPPGGPIPLPTIQALASLADKSKEAKTSVTAPGGEKDGAGAKSSIYAIAKDGSVETLYTSKEQMVFDVLARADGSIIASTGGKGRLLAVDSAKQVTVITDSPEEQMVRMIASGEIVWIASCNQGKVYKLGSAKAKNGSYESKVWDAKTVSAWGKIAWRLIGPAGMTVELATRSGNTEKPDSSWSEWSTAYTIATGQPITSPRARYLQWKATLKSGSSAGTSANYLERVQLAYLQQNLRPQVTSISVLPYGVGLQKTPALPMGTVNLNLSSSGSEAPLLNSPRERGKDRQPLAPRQVLQPGAQAFTWKATDDNDDSLEYSIYFKGDGESEWKLLEKKITDTFYTLDAASLPDGVYTLKVVASDAPSNPYGKFLIGELVSKPFVISNSTPVLEVVSQKILGKRIEVLFRAKTSIGRISTAEFSVDGSDWLLVFPADGIADSAQEDFQFTTAELNTGEHVLGLRASDSNSNTGTTKLIVKIP